MINNRYIFLQNIFTKAEDGDPNQQYDLGIIYDFGWHGIQKDGQKAFEWYAKAAEQGDAKAQNRVGWMYYEGRAVEKDDQKAIEWWEKAADQESAEAHYHLGNVYYNKAKKLYEKASTQGFPLAYFKLGDLYVHGSAVEKDIKKAQELYEKALGVRVIEDPDLLQEERYDV